MSPEKGPLPLSAERLVAARTPPILKRSLPAEVMQKYRRRVSLRRPPAPSQNVREEPPQITPPVVEQAIATAEDIDVKAEGREFTVRIVPAVRDAVEQSGFSPDEMKRFLDRLANALSSKEAVARLPEVPGMPGVRVYKTIIARPRAAEVFRLVFVVLPDSAAVVVVSVFRKKRTV